MNDIKLAEAKSAIIYGDSGLGKSTQAVVFSKWLYSISGKPVRLISAEDSSKTIFEPLIAVGIVEPTFITKVKEPLAMLRNLSKGMWPSGDPKTPWLKYEPGQVSGYVIEGLTSIAELLLEHIRDNHWLLQGQEKNIVEEGGYKIGPATQVGYGFVQDEMLRHVKAFAGLAGVSRILWTAHEVKATDADRVGIRGPAIVGSAKTSAIQKYFGMVLHIDGYSGKLVASKEKSDYTERRIWFTRHADPNFNELYYPAKVTIPFSKVEELTKQFPHGYIIPTPTYGIDAILDAEVQLASEEITKLREFKETIDKKFGGK